MKREQHYFTIGGMYSYDNTLFDALHIPDQIDKEQLINTILLHCSTLESAYPDGDVMKGIIDLWSANRCPDWERAYLALYADYVPIHNYDRHEILQETTTGSGRTAKNTADTTNRVEDIKDNNTRTDDLKETDTYNKTDTRTDNLSETHNGGETTTHENTAYNAGLSATSRDVLERDNDTTNNTGTQTNKQTGTIEKANTGTQKDDRTVNDKEVITRTIGDEEVTESGGDRKNDNYIYGNIGVTTTQQMIESEMNLRYRNNIYEFIAIEFKEKFCILCYIL